MLVVGFPVGMLQANCYLLATEAGQPCVIVDPGQDAVEPIDEALREHSLSPAAVLLTHGHFDHVLSATPVCEEHGVPAWIHPGDRALLTDPLSGLDGGAAAFFGDVTLREPADLRELGQDGAELQLAGLRIIVDHSPGHTRGSVLFRVETDEGGRLVLTGDTLFAGSVGRTDLPGGSSRSLTESLRDKVLSLPDDTVVLPGHGPSSTIGQERVSNPYLVALPGARRAASDR
ncbi:MAG TPA: MBL fold metallo-hydrolase [Pseudonocardiaceae bacterium]